jgi:hypothetical protein
MFYSQFSKRLQQTNAKVGILESTYFYGHCIQKTEEGAILINGTPTSHETLSEAKQHIRYTQEANNIIQEIKEDFYKDNRDKIITIIKENHNIKVTNNIVDNYIQIASDNSFSIDPVVLDIRNINNYDKLIEGKLHYKLQDNSIVAISEETQNVINKLLQDNNTAIEYMKESSDNFLKILDIIIREQ